VLLRDVAYGQIPRAARAQKHALAATWIESLSRPEDHAEMLADHYSRALEYGRAAGAAALSDIEDKAARYLVLAGDRTFPLDAAKADAYYARALELLPERGPARADVLAKRGETSRLAARPLEAERLYEQAIDAFRARGDLVGAARTMVKLAVAVWDRGETARARELRQHAVELLEREQPGPELARAYAATAGGFMTAGSARDSLTWAEKALPLAERFGVDDLSVRVPQFRGVARWDLGDVGGLDDLRDALRLGLELGLGFETSTAYINLAHFLWLTDGPAQALEVERAGIDFAQRRGMPGQAMWAEQEMLWFLFDLGEWDELRVLADDLIERDRARGGSQVGATALIFKAQVLFHRGRLDEAAALYEEFLPRAREIGDLQVLTPALATAALVEQTRGDAVRAVSLVDELGDASRDRNPWHRIRYAADAARVLVAAGHHDVGEHLSLDDRGVIGARSLTSLLTVRAVTAEAGGDLQHALDLYCDAAQRWTDYGFALERGQALLGAARCLVALERRPDAVPALAEARETFAQLQATPLVAESDGVLGQAAQAESPVASDTSGV
jgi:tetratricopeptide (TPR) repeat protein